MKSIVIGKNQAGQRLDKFLRKCLPLAGESFLYKMLRKKNITLNGKKAEGREILALNDEVCVFFSEETFAKFSGREPDAPTPGESAALGMQEYEAAYARLRGITVLYEDADCLILNKPIGVLSQKAAPGDITLNEWLVGYLLSEKQLSQEELATFRPSVCNRIDRNTSGIVLCGKSLAGLQSLSGHLRERRIRKFYRAICVGALREAAQAHGYLAKDGAGNQVTVSRSPRDGASGQAVPIHTVYTPIAVTEDYTLLEVELVTGKSHQIRAQLADMGHPLVGDPKYGDASANRLFRKKYGLEHQLLHACRVTFPGDGGEKSVCAPCPDIFQELEKNLFG